jgi:hypothetical protein
LNVKIFTCVDHDGHLVGVASVVVARSEETARQLLQIELRSRGLSGNKPFSLQEIDISEPRAIILQDGDY